MGKALSGVLSCPCDRSRNSISIISGQWVGNNEILYASEPLSQLQRVLPPAGLNPEIQAVDLDNIVMVIKSVKFWNCP